jgi:hypothetical protein
LSVTALPVPPIAWSLQMLSFSFRGNSVRFPISDLGLSLSGPGFCPSQVLDRPAWQRGLSTTVTVMAGRQQKV